MVLESNTLDVLFVKDGQQGEDGKILYTWIKYAKDANGTGMTDDPNGAVYIGISYNNESSTESNDPTQYAWTKIQGADGKKGEDAYTIFLENENISFATDENRDPLSEQAYTSGITIMKGAKPVTDFIIGDIAKTQGIAVAKTDTAIAISVINGNPLPSDNGAIEIPITVGGTVFKKILSWTCSKKGDQGIQGPQGVQGEKGKDGTSVTITNKSITYQLSASGTVVPTGTWQTSPQTIPEGQYQWTKTSVTYSDGNKTESYSISYRGKNGSDGTSVKTTSTSVKYQVGDSGTTKPTGAWQNSVPTVAQGKYLWTQTIVNYSDGNSTESYSVSYKGIDGSNGSNGMNAATVYLYQRATSTPSKPSNALTYTFSTTKITGTLNNGWSTAIPTGTDAVYVTVASVSSKSDTTTIATSAWSAPVVLAQNGKSGSDGKAGLNVATIYLYQRATSKPSKPSASVTYTFNTGVASGLNNGWSQKIPDGTNPLYVTLATASSNTATDTVLSSEWSDVVVMAQNGEDGQDGTSITITSKSVTYQASSSGTTTPTGTWSTSVPTVNNGQYLWTKTTVQYSDDNKTEAYSVSYKGTNGTNGTSVTVSKTEVTYQVSTSGTTAPTGTWSTTMPTCDQGLYLWTKTYVKYSDGKDTTSYAVSYKGIDGEKFAFNMLRETNQGSKHWEQHSSGGKYFVEDFITEDNINAVKLICTEAISTSNWSYVSFKDIKMLKQLKPSTKYTLSYDIKANRSGTISHSICNGDASNFCTNTVVVNNIIGNETWQHISVVLTTNDLKTTPTNAILYLGRNALSKVGYSIIKNLKLTEGTVDTPWAPHPEDLEGRGVSQTVQYYLATSQASGVTSSTSGWSTDITTQKLTADKKYLWNCYQTKYSDGTSEPISTPKVIGVYGDKGTSTKIIRTGYKYTQNNIDTFSASGYSRTWDTADATTGLKVGDNVLLRVKNTTKGSDCLIFASITAIPSNYSLTCTSYGLIDNGADGQDGEDGAGFHWNLLKYSGDLSKQVLGGAGTYTATVESIEDKTTPSGQAEKITYTVQGTGGKFIQTGKYIKEGDIKQGKTYTVSVWCKCSSIKSTGVINAEFLDNKTYVNPTLSTEWQQYVVTGVANKDVTSTSSASAISFYYSDNMSVGDIFYISSPKVEEGDKASPWCTTYEETLAKNLSITPSSQYFKSTDGGKTFAPNTITIKPTIQGEISFGKWQYSIDGGVSFTDVMSEQKGLTISNNVLTVSKDSSLYSDAVTMITFRAVADDSSFYDTCSIAKIYDVSDIGDGRNLLWNSNFAKTDEAITGTTNSWGLHTRGTNLVASIDTSTKHNGFNTLKTVSAANGDKNSSNDLEWFAWGISERTSDNLHSKNQNYTLSFYAKASVTTDFIVRWGYDAYGADTTRTLTTNWQKYEIKLHQATSAYSITIIFKLLTAGTVWFSEFKLEKGSSATGYSTAPEDLQTAILSTKSEISDVSLKVDKNKQAIEQRVEKTTYQQDLNLVKGDISKANEGLNKWRYEIYPKSLFASEYQGKSTMDVFAKNTNLTPSQSVLINDTDFGKSWAYGNNYIGYALTFVKFSAAKSIAITFKHDDGAHLYLNGKLIGGDDTCNTGSGESLTLSFIQGWNCLEVVLNEKSGGEYIGLGTTISAISECQLMNCYYGTPVARQSHITNQLVQNTTDIDGVSTKVSKVTSVIGDNGENFTSFKNDYSDFKQTMNGFKTTVGQTYVTKDDFNGLEIGGRNLLVQKNITQGYLTTDGKGSFIGSGGGDQTSDWIDVSGNKYITITLYEDFTNTNNSGRYCEYDADKNCINTVDYNPRQKSSIIIKLKSNTKYIRVTAIECKTRRYKIEKGNKATDWTPAPEDVNGKIVNAETIANQTANKFSWIVKSGTSSSNFEITDRLMNLVSANINLDGVVSFMNTAKGDGRKNLYNLDYSSFENVASQEDAICYAKDNGVTSVGIDNSVSYDGNKSLKISYTTANLNSSTTPLYLGSSANNYGCVKIQAGKQYILSCYVKSDSATGLFMIDIQGHDTPDTKTDGLYLSNIDPRRLPGSSTYVDLNTNWQRAVCAIKVADNATGLYWSVVPLIWGRPSSSSAPKTFNVWVDCIMLEEVDSISNEPGTYILDKETIIDGGSIKTDTITGNQILAGSITADKIATDAIKSRNYISSGGTQGSFLNLGDGSFTSPNLSWDSNGNLIAKNANLSGEITATKGSIAGWTIISDKMYTTGSGKYTGIGKYGSAYAFWAGATSNDNGNSAVFKVGHTGKLTATDVDITGIVTATSGKIGRYDITETYLMTNSGSNASGIGGDQAFWAGAEDSNSAPFRVGYDGSVYCGSFSSENSALKLTLNNGYLTITDKADGTTAFRVDEDGYTRCTICYAGNYFGKSMELTGNIVANDLTANGYLYCSEVHSSGAVVIGADSESFYWAHGFQIARGTSWGGVCVGDDGQQLRLYGTSIWASHSISTSDENLKENFTTLDQYEDFYMSLNPIGFNYIGDYDGKKTHFGFGAHKTEDVLESEGYDADKFAVVTHRPLVQEDIEKRFGKDVEVDIETEYGVSYTEFIALNTHMIQKTRRELTKVKQEKADLEVRLQAIEAKLGL